MAVTENASDLMQFRRQYSETIRREERAFEST